MAVITHPKFFGFDKFYRKNKPMEVINALKAKDPSVSFTIDENVHVSVESSIALIINERYRINILCTCQQIEALCIGYLVCEGLITSIDDISKIELKDENMVYISTNTSTQDFFYWTEIRTSGCIGIKQQYEKIDKIIDSDITISPEIFFKSQEEMNKSGNIWKISGGTHMSSLFQSDGKLLSFSEDVGRHNTLDKIIGEAILNEINLSNCFVITSGRLSAAMISKLLRAGIPIVISISAPTAQGIKLAKQKNMTVIGFSRPPFFNSLR